MKLRRWVDILLTIIAVVYFIRMFFVEEVLGGLYLISIMVILIVQFTFGTLYDEISAKINKLISK